MLRFHCQILRQDNFFASERTREDTPIEIDRTTIVRSEKI